MLGRSAFCIPLAILFGERLETLHRVDSADIQMGVTQFASAAENRRNYSFAAQPESAGAPVCESLLSTGADKLANNVV